MCLPPCSWPTIPSAKNNWDTRNVFLRRANVTMGPFVSPPGSSWCSSSRAGIHKLGWAFDMNLDALPDCGSAPEKWKMPLRQLGAVQRSQGRSAALGQDPFWGRTSMKEGKGAYWLVSRSNNGPLVSRNKGNSAAQLPSCPDLTFWVWAK